MIQLISAEEVVSISKWIPITKSYRYEMKPTKNQEVKMTKTLDTCRHVFNHSLAERKEGWENGGWNVEYNDQQNYLPELRNDNETGKYLQEVYAQVLQDVMRRVDKAYKNFFRRVKNGEKPGFPRFKGYGRYDSFTFPQYGNGCQIINKRGEKDEKGDIIRLSNIGDVKFIKHRKIGDPGIPYQTKTVTVKREVDKWFVSFTIETFMEMKIPIEVYNNKKIYDEHIKPLDDLIYRLFTTRMGKNKIYETIKEEVRNLLIEISKFNVLNSTIEELNEKCIGTDMGLSSLIATSNKKIVETQKFLRKSEKRLAIEQRKLAKKRRKRNRSCRQED